MRRSYLPAALLAAGLAVPLPSSAGEACDGYAKALAAMASADQALRTRIDHLDSTSPGQQRLRSHVTLVDRSNTERLKTWIARCGWPARKQYGDRAAGDAWLLAQHADHDLAFQKQALALIERDAAASGKGIDQQFALLSDRVAVAEKRPQRYGTQLAFRSSGCDLEFHPMDDRAQVEARRAQLKMPSLDAYKRLVLEMQHCPVPPQHPADHHYAPPVGQGKQTDTVTRK